MLKDHGAIATVAVKDLGAAKKYYSEVLGLALKDDNQEALTFSAGKSVLLVYRSQFAGSNQATGVNWSVGNDFDAIISALQGKGQKFERYDMPGLERNGDIHSAGGMRMVWFKDPDGNIHSIMNTPEV
jgi:catechol 2,3-dioxygenase-like lactoylglutathione lyase family enzyme